MLKRFLTGFAAILASSLPTHATLIEDAENLTIKKDGTGYEVTIKDPVHPERSLSYSLIPKGQGIAESGRAAKGAVEIPFPVERIVSLSTTYIGPLQEIDALDRIVAVDNSSYAYSPELLRLTETGEIKEVGNTGNLDLETIIAIKPDLVIMTRINPGQDSFEQRLAAAGIPVLVTAAWKESDPLARSEWIKLFGLLTGNEERAFRLYEETRSRYRELRGMVEESDSPPPKILLSAPYGGTWYMPGGASFTARLLRDAGAESLWAENESTGSFPVDLESALSRGFQADFWINPGRFQSLEELARSDERFRILPCFKDGAVYNRTRLVARNGGNDFWESGLVYPDRILADLIRIFHPGLLPQHQLIYYEKLEQ